jgi:hypothetical protein
MFSLMGRPAETGRFSRNVLVCATGFVGAAVFVCATTGCDRTGSRVARRRQRVDEFIMPPSIEPSSNRQSFVLSFLPSFPGNPSQFTGRMIGCAIRSNRTDDALDA